MTKKDFRGITLLILMVINLVACSTGPASTTGGLADKADKNDKCGDGACQGPENVNNCPQDCPQPDEAGIAELDQSEIREDMQDRPLYLGIMVHLEGWDQELENKDMFDHHIRLMREYADLFEKHNAKLTWETIDIALASATWGENILLEMESRGHHSGVHADLGGSKDYDCSQFSTQLRELKEDLETLGVSVRHASGVVSHCDWVTAMVEADYEFTTGMVAYGVMSLPMALRPEEYRSCRNPSMCHDTFPADLADRLHPWRMQNGDNWINHHPSGQLVMLPSSEGLACYQEEFAGLTCGQDFTQSDIDLFFSELDKALALSDPNLINIYYVSWSLGKALDMDLMETWLAGIDTYVDQGLVAWKTLPEMYDVYVEWEQGHQ
jgi:hypothetical protein